MPRKLNPPIDGRDDDVRILATIPLRSSEPGYAAEEFRVVAKRYGGEDKLDLRTFYQDKQGEWRPTPRGTLLPQSAIPALKVAVDALCVAAFPTPKAGASAPEF